MNERLKQLTLKHSDMLESISFIFFHKKLEDEEDKSFVINLILSSYVTAMCNMLMHTVGDNEHDNIMMQKFIKEFMDKIRDSNAIANIEKYANN